MAGARLSQLVTVRGRFHRSISLARDWDGSRDLSEYIVTPAVASIAEQILEELRDRTGARAWSLTGPYGTGKSAFALFLADVLASKRPAHEDGRALRKTFLAKKKGMVPVLVQAERAPLLPAILASLAKAADSVSRPIAREARKLIKSAEISGEAVALLLERAAERFASEGRGGIALLVDEFGKSLEYLAANPHQEDIYALQQLAEAASRSQAPILFVTILHTGFSDYLGQGDEVRRSEWQKVQGRFRDIPFQLPSDQLLTLVTHSLERKFENGVERAYRREGKKISSSGELREALGRGTGVRELLDGALPIHPITSLILWPLFRSKAAQNERSLFAFLTSHEPHGFQEFLRRSEASSRSAPLYGLGDLYDYISTSLGVGAFSGTDSRKWALVHHALQRVPADAPRPAMEIVKAIGLLAQYGPPAGLQPTRKLLELALGTEGDVKAALKLLEKESIVVYRRHNKAYGLWEGSDLDLEAVFSEAQARLSDDALDRRLNRSVRLSHEVARAHYIETGTLRFFEVRITSDSAAEIDSSLRDPTTADGTIVFVLGGGERASERREEISRLSANHQLSLIAFPRIGDELVEALADWESWKWVRDNVTELDGDPVARQEVTGRVEAARDRFDSLAGPAFGLAGHALNPALSDWFSRGRSNNPATPREFQKLLSRNCKQVFNKAPVLKNELLNRHNLSSAAARARRNLIERMIQHQHEHRLGIEGFPAEFSMYQAMLVEGGFHPAQARSFRLRAPSDGGWKPAWQEIETFLAETTSGRRALTELTDILEAPPYGLRQGPIPVLVAAALVIKGSEIAVYEEGLFVPDVTIEVVERLIRRPETFELQSYRLKKAEKAVLGALAKIARDDSTTDSDLISVVRALVRVVSRLPAYAKQTRNVGPKAQSVRDALMNATDPKSLVFSELPAALGIQLDKSDSASQFARALAASTEELSCAYLKLLDKVEEAVRNAFGIKEKGPAARRVLQLRAKPLVPFATDPLLQVFVREAAREDKRNWREVLGRAIHAGKPPSHWRDDEVTALQVKMQTIAAEFDRLEELVKAAGKDTTSTVVSVGVLENGTGERRTVVSLPPTASKDVSELAAELGGVLEGSRTLSPRMKLIAMASALRDFSNEVANEEN